MAFVLAGTYFISFRRIIKGRSNEGLALFHSRSSGLFMKRNNDCPLIVFCLVLVGTEKHYAQLQIVSRTLNGFVSIILSDEKYSRTIEERYVSYLQIHFTLPCITFFKFYALLLSPVDSI